MCVPQYRHVRYHDDPPRFQFSLSLPLDSTAQHNDKIDFNRDDACVSAPGTVFCVVVLGVSVHQHLFLDDDPDEQERQQDTAQHNNKIDFNRDDACVSAPGTVFSVVVLGVSPPSKLRMKRKRTDSRWRSSFA